MEELGTDDPGLLVHVEVLLDIWYQLLDYVQSMLAYSLDFIMAPCIDDLEV